MIIQKEITLPSFNRGFHLITDYILDGIGPFKVTKGILHIFIKHTSASILINENSDPSVRDDFESFFNNMVPENQSYYTHISEGSDDLPAHVKSSIIGNHLSIPVSKNGLNLGIWQGIYLCEHRNSASERKIVISVIGD